MLAVRLCCFTIKIYRRESERTVALATIASEACWSRLIILEVRGTDCNFYISVRVKPHRFEVHVERREIISVKHSQLDEY